MWHLKSIYAKNLCSFLELAYSPKQGSATLIFGQNLDDDSQNSNGSGKSALIEAISVAMTGEPLRKVVIDEIINDNQNEAVISAVLTNDMLGEQMTINRRLSRKQPQQIQILKQTGPYDTDIEEISQATVADYNKYILDQLGLSKDDIFANFILTDRKYKSFLASSDKDKKELINRFSNGVMVDESIEQLHKDMEPIKKDLDEAEKEVATCTGRVDAMASEIEKAINESAERKATNESRIENWKNLIAGKRANIRTAREAISSLEESLDNLEALDTKMQEIEAGELSAEECLVVITEQFKANELELLVDYDHEIEVLTQQLKSADEIAKRMAKEFKAIRASLQTSENEYTATSKELADQQAENEKNLRDCEERIQKLQATVRRLQEKSDKLSQSQMKANRAKVNLENQLAGVIQCPKCKHEFVLGSDLNIEEARGQLKALIADLVKISSDLTKNTEAYNKTVAEGKNEREIETSLNAESRKISKDIMTAEEAISSARKKCEDYEKNIETAKKNLSTVRKSLSNIRKRIFDEVFDTIDSAYKRREAQIKVHEEEISALEGSIESYEKAIEEARQASEESILESLRESKKQYQEALQKAQEKKNLIAAKLNELTAQEATFIEFKTYLANTKINAIAQITNEFLATIGSDIRVVLSGYTILKSGKVRDKISVTLLRNGVDCGSFEKFSAGERVRVELASILSMNQLTNLNCEDGKGLDLLIADEVLDSADEQGLASVFKALNQTQITSLVVSHGMTNEGYPNKITVIKSNGVSSIHETASTN